MIEYINAFELVVLGLAFCASRSRYTPAMLVIYNLWVQFLNNHMDIKEAYYISSYNAGSISYEYANDQLMGLYLLAGFTFAIFGVVCLLLKTKMSYFTGLLILAQSALQLFAGVAIYLEVSYGLDANAFFDVYFGIDKLFVILFSFSAWKCVYLSRKANNGRVRD